MRSRPDEMSAAEKRSAGAWRDHVAGGKACAVCGSRISVKAHHVVYQQVIREIARTAGVDFATWRWDKRNGPPLCNDCHTAHHGTGPRIDRALLVARVPAAFTFARELGPVAVAHLQREYPLAPTRPKETEGWKHQ